MDFRGKLLQTYSTWSSEGDSELFNPSASSSFLGEPIT